MEDMMYKVKIKKKYPTGWGLAPGWWEAHYYYRYSSTEPWSDLAYDVCDSWESAMHAAQITLRALINPSKVSAFIYSEEK
jgi:hypothetical protein